jgi:hypothetical protein
MHHRRNTPSLVDLRLLDGVEPIVVGSHASDSYARKVNWNRTLAAMTSQQTLICANCRSNEIGSNIAD